MVVAHGHEADHTRCSDGVRHALSRRARIATRIKKRACGGIASHASRLMAVYNDYLRAWTVPAESHLDLENKARSAFFCKSRVNGRCRALTAIANNGKHLLETVESGPRSQRCHVGRQSRAVQKVREFGDSTARSRCVRRVRYG